MDFFWLLESSPAWVGVCSLLVRWNCGWHATLHLWPCGVWGVRGPWRVGIHDVFLEKAIEFEHFFIDKKKQVLPTPNHGSSKKNMFVFFYMIQNLLSISEPFFFSMLYFVAPLQSEMLSAWTQPTVAPWHLMGSIQWEMLGDWHLGTFSLKTTTSLEASKLIGCRFLFWKSGRWVLLGSILLLFLDLF